VKISEKNWSINLYAAETWTLRNVDQKCVESFEMCSWRKMENVSWTDRVRNGEVLHSVKEERNILHEKTQRKVTWIGHFLRGNCLLKQVTEGEIKGMKVEEEDINRMSSRKREDNAN
jgi:hypothetical protein